MVNILTGARLHGAVRHVIVAGSVTACGRVVIAGKGQGNRFCKTCVRINTDARTLNDRERKAARDARIQASLTTPTEEFTTWEWELSQEEWMLTLEKIDKINARCAKKGIPGGLKVEFTKELKETWNFGIKVEKEFYLTKITGIAPKLPGWSFIATLDYDGHAGLIVRGYPGAAPVDRTALREGWCDHCQTNRMRHVTYVMRNDETGEQVQVGSSCIKDFTGWTALPYSFENIQKDLEFGGEFSGPKDVTVLSALAISWAVVQEFGYTRSQEQNSTKSVVMDVIDPPKPTKHNAQYLEDLKRLGKYADSMEEKAIELRQFILSDEFKLSDRSDYPANMKAIIGSEKVSFRNLGFLVSAPQAWSRHLEQKLVVKANAQESPSKHVGAVKERLTLTLTVESMTFVETEFGCSSLYRMTDAEGNVFKWFSTSGILDDLVEKTVTLVGTVKKHDVYKGINQTVLTRCKLAK